MDPADIHGAPTMCNCYETHREDVDAISKSRKADRWCGVSCNEARKQKYCLQAKYKVLGVQRRELFHPPVDSGKPCREGHLELGPQRSV